MGMMENLGKKFKHASEVVAEVMNSPCCDEDENTSKSTRDYDIGRSE